MINLVEVNIKLAAITHEKIGPVCFCTKMGRCIFWNMVSDGCRYLDTEVTIKVKYDKQIDIWYSKPPKQCPIWKNYFKCLENET